jgi:retinal rod rhodopsin-sensitive cGMP 3',5'-cyclic phosphodiesterase subunit delta
MCDNHCDSNANIEHKPHATKLQKIREGFKINSMRMKDGSNGKVMWECKEWDLSQQNNTENLPKELLQCHEVVREINFSSMESIENLELVQNFYLQDELIESSRFVFGFVIPNSTNNWEQTIEAKDEMIPSEILSGNLMVETIFLTNGHIITRNNILIYYV